MAKANKKRKFSRGDRVRLHSDDYKPSGLFPGALGTVIGYDGEYQDCVRVTWDGGNEDPGFHHANLRIVGRYNKNERKEILDYYSAVTGE